MKRFISLFILFLFLVPAFAQAPNTLQNWDDNFHWDDPDNPPGTVTYNFYESSTSGGPWSRVNTTPITASPFNYPGATTGSWYTVSAVLGASGVGFEALSAEVQFTVPQPPLRLRWFQVIAAFFKWVFGGWA